MATSAVEKSRVTWSLAEISEVTGLSKSFLRYEVRRGNLPVRKFGRRVLVLDGDLRAYIENGSTGSKNEKFA